MTSRVSCGVRCGYSNACSRPWWLIMGGEPAVKWRSEALRSITCSRTSAKSNSIRSPIGWRVRLRDPCYLGYGRDSVLDLLEAVRTERSHALRDGDLANFVGLGALDREVADLVRDRHNLVEAGPALVAGAAAAAAAHGLVRLEVEGHVEPGLLERRDAQHGPALAVRAELAHEPLGDDTHDRRGAQERLDVHFGEARDRRRRVVRVQRRQHEVAGERRLDRDLGRLAVADLADHDHV